MAINRGRFQAQSNFLEESENWSTDDHISKQIGHDLLNNLYNKLTNDERLERNIAFHKVRNLINQAPIGGHSAQLIKSFYDIRNRNARLDVEIRAGVAFITINN